MLTNLTCRVCVCLPLQFCEWVARKNCGLLLPPRVEPSVSMTSAGRRTSGIKAKAATAPVSRVVATLDQVEAEVKQLAAAPKELHRVWTALDANSNGSRVWCFLLAYRCRLL